MKKFISTCLSISICLFGTTTYFRYSAWAQAQPQSPPPQAPGAEVGPDGLLQQAEKLYENLEYEKAIQILIQVMNIPNTNQEQKVNALLYLGVCWTALGNAQEAVSAFMELLKIHAEFRLPQGISPSIAAMFKEALKRMQLPENPADMANKPNASPKVVVDVQAPSSASAGNSINIKIHLTDPESQAKRIVLYYRRLGGGDYSKITVRVKPGQSNINASISGAMIGETEGTLHYYVDAMDVGGLILAQAGSMIEPQKIILSAGGKGFVSKYKWWIVGVGGGLVVAGGILASVFLLSGDSGGPPADAANVSIFIR